MTFGKKAQWVIVGDLRDRDSMCLMPFGSGRKFYFDRYSYLASYVHRRTNDAGLITRAKLQSLQNKIMVSLLLGELDPSLKLGWRVTTTSFNHDELSAWSDRLGMLLKSCPNTHFRVI